MQMFFLKTRKRADIDLYRKKLSETFKKQLDISRMVLICADGAALFDDKMELILEVYYANLGLQNLKSKRKARTLAKDIKRQGRDVFYALNPLKEMVYRKS